MRTDSIRELGPFGRQRGVAAGFADRNADARAAATSVLFVKTSSLGDVIHMMPAITDARRAHPDAHISWLIDETYVSLARLHPAVDEIIPVAWRRWRRNLRAKETWTEMQAFSRHLRQRRYDAVIDTQGLIHSGYMARMADGPCHGYDAGSIREKLATPFYDVRHSVGWRLSAIARNRQLTGRALGYTPSDRVDYGLPQIRLAAPAPFALLAHGTSQPKKAWPSACWSDVAAALSERGLKVVLPAGSPAEHERAAFIAADLPHVAASPPMPLERIVDLIRNAALLVGVDTGLLHLATAFGVPAVAVFTASDPALTGPIGDGPISITGRKGRPATVEEVLVGADSVLTRAAAASGRQAQNVRDGDTDTLNGNAVYRPVAGFSRRIAGAGG